jgi:hypothetical protein
MKRLAPALVLAVVLAGCQETSAPDIVRPLVSDASPLSRPPLLTTATFGEGDVWSADFLIDPAGTTITSGLHSVRFPANSVCDPAASGYGPGTWELPCTPIATALRLHVDVTMKDGRHVLKFTPDIRFVPASDSARFVMLTVNMPEVQTAPDPSGYTILWTSPQGTLVDEGLTDSSLRTIVRQSEGLLLRRLKHFSGYTVYSGKSCDPATLPPGETCPAGEGDVAPRP